MSTVNHYFEPPHMTKTSRGNVKGCCDAPEADHRLAVDGTPLRIQLKRDVRYVHGRGDLGKGAVLSVRLYAHEGALQEVRPSKWGTNVFGQFAELDKGEYKMVQSVCYIIPHKQDDYSMATVIPVKWAREV